ncbi:MAG TPA: hypothetical protein VMT35_05425 [Ignavibacteriaceae bacterium]|nr:hypothetical protein [Ignavibacteriaceae bacterium]
MVNLDNTHFDNLTGVYLIWQGEDKRNVIKVGKGLIREKLAAMRIDKKVQEFGPDLFVTWGEVSPDKLNGVEAYLFKEFHPIIQEELNGTETISVNLP